MKSIIFAVILNLCAFPFGLLIGHLPTLAKETEKTELVKRCPMGYEPFERQLSDGRKYVSCRKAAKQCYWDGNVQRCMRVIPKAPKRVKEQPKPFKPSGERKTADQLLDELSR